VPALRRDLLNPTLLDIFETFQLDKNYVSGKNACLTDEKGISYLDFIAQYGALPFGYNPDFIWDSLLKARERSLPSLVQPSLPGEALKMANMLADCSPGDLAYCTFCQSGTEAVEAAIKLARSTTGKEIIVSTANSFHGKTLGSLSATGKDSYQGPFRAPAPGFARIPFNDIDALERLFAEKSEEIAGFIVEAVQGEGGIVLAREGYLKAAQELCNKNNVILIVDEIQTGLGRTGKLFACEYENIEPDIMVLAKALGGGLLPLGVCISSPRIWNEDFAMLHSSTFANNNLTCAVGIAVLEKLLEGDQKLIREVAQKGDYLLENLNELANRYPDAVKEVRGKGFMVGMEFHDMKDCGSYDITYIADQGGFTTLLTGFLLNVYQIRLAPYLNSSTTLRLEPALTISYKEMDYVINALEDVCRILEYHDYARLYRYLIGDYRKPAKIKDYQPFSRNIKSSSMSEGEELKEKFAFIIHYPAPEDVLANNPSFESFSRDELYSFMKWQSRVTEPGICCHMPAIRSLAGSVAEGWLIGVPFGARELKSLPREDTVAVIKKAVDMARDLGAGIVGLGALTSVVSRGGRAVTGRDVAITSGNSFTTLMAIEALLLGAQKMHIDMEQATGAVIGATGSIGRACALLLSDRLSKIALLGNPSHIKSSNNRLQTLARDILVRAHKRRISGDSGGVSDWLSRIIEILEKINLPEAEKFLPQLIAGDNINLDLIQDIADFLGIECPLTISLEIKETLRECNLIVAASSSPDYLVYPEDLQAGAVVCDVARPADVAPEVYQKRNDVLVLEGGLVQYPDNIAFGPNLGYRDGVNLACLSETVLLALEGIYRDFSIGNKLSLEDIEYLRSLGQKHGLGLAGLMMGSKEISDEEIEQIYHNSLNLKQVQNL
jgi:acetylornithine/succinyldiaminopimelate/putrescine aminotransferase/predicted amino acid dehydrogenase